MAPPLVKGKKFFAHPHFLLVPLLGGSRPISCIKECDLGFDNNGDLRQLLG
jgi:hypothetical protein